MKILIYGTFFMLFAVGWAHYGTADDRQLDKLTELHFEANDNTAENAVSNYIDNILKLFLEKIRSIIKNKEPYPVPNLPPQEISDKNVQVNITLTNVTENYASTFVINQLKNNFLEMTEAFDLTFPKLDFFGNYTIKGTVLKRKVHGSGKFKVRMITLHTWGKAYAYLVNGYVQLKKLPIDYTVNRINASATGLTVEGLTQKQVQALLSSALLQYFTDNEPIVSETISEIVVNQVNKFLYGMSISDFIEWLKHFITPPSV